MCAFIFAKLTEHIRITLLRKWFSLLIDVRTRSHVHLELEITTNATTAPLRRLDAQLSVRTIFEGLFLAPPAVQVRTSGALMGLGQVLEQARQVKHRCFLLLPPEITVVVAEAPACAAPAGFEALALDFLPMTDC